jgi:hypothetical protein
LYVSCMSKPGKPRPRPDTTRIHLFSRSFAHDEQPRAPPWGHGEWRPEALAPPAHRAKSTDGVGKMVAPTRLPPVPAPVPPARQRGAGRSAQGADDAAALHFVGTRSARSAGYVRLTRFTPRVYPPDPAGTLLPSLLRARFAALALPRATYLCPGVAYPWEALVEGNKDPTCKEAAKTNKHCAHVMAEVWSGQLSKINKYIKQDKVISNVGQLVSLRASLHAPPLPLSEFATPPLKHTVDARAHRVTFDHIASRSPL